MQTTGLKLRGNCIFFINYGGICIENYLITIKFISVHKLWHITHVFIHDLLPFQSIQNEFQSKQKQTFLSWSNLVERRLNLWTRISSIWIWISNIPQKIVSSVWYNLFTPWYYVMVNAKLKLSRTWPFSLIKKLIQLHWMMVWEAKSSISFQALCLNPKA